MGEISVKPKRVIYIFDKIIEIGREAAIVMVIFLMIGISARVFLRYTLDVPINWVVDISTIFQVYLTFMAAAWLLREEGHVSIDIILSYLRPRYRYFLQIINSILCAIICIIVLVYGAIETWSSWKSKLYLGMPMEPPKWSLFIIIPIGSILLLIQFLRRMKSNLEKFKSSKKS
jgi:TRAP-type C4-dicarboxylate transport system permease small subunit